VSQNYPIVQN
nr:Chain P, gag polyprotein [synthetic construct]1KJ4_S Chain S, gag polyprotein [synthetic construct]1MT7_P Chain P, Substrate analogue [synthetic construct]